MTQNYILDIEFQEERLVQIRHQRYGWQVWAMIRLRDRKLNGRQQIYQRRCSSCRHYLGLHAYRPTTMKGNRDDRICIACIESRKTAQ